AEAKRMATSDDLFRLQVHLPGLAGAVYGAAEAKFAETGWVAAVLDARYFAEGGGQIAKVRVELAGGSVGSVKLPGEASQALRELGAARAESADRWYGLRLRVTAAGECETAFDYDARCAEDEAFFDA
ncbi:hypothetical protein R5W23_000948, partial [Gemmata sp. JC673]